MLTVPPERASVTPYSRPDVLRILRIPAKQLRGWERAGLIAPQSGYSFQDLGQLRKLRDLRALRISAASIRASVLAMRAVSGVANPLLEAGTTREGSRLVFRHSGSVMDPIARQFVFDFDLNGCERLSNVETLPSTMPERKALLEAEIQARFIEAVRDEELGRVSEAAVLYEQILAAKPDHAPSCINLGTIHYNRRAYSRAEELYRQATVADASYALAYFDLGNVLDELQRLPEAVEAYKKAIHLMPRYGDAHYNLALTYERRGERRKALHHWTAYLKLDRSGPWASHARTQVRKILDREKMRLVKGKAVGGAPRRTQSGVHAANGAVSLFAVPSAQGRTARS
ncbi:tetratricopeptide repeat protein [Acidipila rosea]|uniref:Tetratricopeptide repeat protein n=1 Tax=Acidipila rosea TaxID=768535 RepID=A0A4R1L368_9BACT|nr:tetratricopeptide repeat protein [Acidipila rosea]TCK72468.1 tetratricopeptide repeat protein [Acidipila rosea]